VGAQREGAVAVPISPQKAVTFSDAEVAMGQNSLLKGGQ
jgi:hypothetical protein